MAKKDLSKIDLALEEATSRTIVKGVYDSEVSFDQSSEDILDAFSTAYNQIVL